MKLATRDIAPYATRRQTHAVVLLYGPDRGLVKKRAETLGKFICPDLNDPFNVAVLSGSQIADDPARLIDEASAISMMGGDRLVRIQEAGDTIADSLKSYLKAPVSGTFIVIEAGELGKESKLRKLCEAEAHAAALPCYVQEGADLSRTIGAALGAAHIRIDRDALALMAASIGGDHQQVQSEIEKLITYINPGPAGATATYADVAACCGAMGLATLDAFVDDLLMGETARAFTLYQRLMDDGTEVIAILRALLAHGRKLQTTEIRIQNGDRLEDILDEKNPPVFFKRKAAFTAHLKKWPLQRRQKMMHDLLICEAKMKSSEDAAITIPQTFLSIGTRAGRA